MDGTGVGLIGARIPLFLYLVQGVVRRAVELELKDIHPRGRLDDAVGPALALLLFREHEVGAENAEDKVESIVEIAFLLRLHVLPTHRVRDAGKEGRQALAPCVEVIAQESTRQLYRQGVRRLLRAEIVGGNQREETLFHLVVGQIEQVGVGEAVVVLDGQITALIDHWQRALHVRPVVDKIRRVVILPRQFVEILVRMAEQADQITGRTRAKPIILDIPNAKRIEQAKGIEDVRLPLTEMITVIMPLQQLAHLLGAHPHFVRHSVHLVMKCSLQFRLRDTADRLIGRTHTDILRLVETAEHTHLRKLRHTREQHEAQVLVSSLEGRVETLERLAVDVFYQHLPAIAYYFRPSRVEHIKQRLIILINEHHTLLARHPMHMGEQIDKALAIVEVGISLVAILLLPFLYDTPNQFG